MNANWQLYSCIDAAVTYKLFQELQKEDHLDELLPWYEQTTDLLGPAIFMMTAGLAVDVERLKTESGRVAEEIERLEEKLNSLVGFPLNSHSSKQCCGYFYGILGHAPYVGTSGNPTCDDKALARLVRKGVEPARLVQRIRGLSKLRSTYLEIEFDTDNRLRCSIKTTGTRTSRLSTSKTIFGTGGNMQNLPPAFRSFIVPDEGHFFVEMDKAKAEWVITAYVANEPNMIAALESGLDVHAVTGARIFNVPLEIALLDDKIIGKSTDEDEIAEKRAKLPELAKYQLPRMFSVRQGGKKTNHACNYIMGYRRFALENEIPENLAKILVNNYSKVSYPGLERWWERVERGLALNRKVENCFGRPFYFYRTLNFKLVQAAVATIPQSTSVEVLNRGLCAIYQDAHPCMRPLRLGMQVHDSILFQYPLNDLANAVRAILRCKTHIEPTLNAEGRRFKIDTDCAVGLNWGDQSEDNPHGMQKIKLGTEDAILTQLTKLFT